MTKRAYVFIAIILVLMIGAVSSQDRSRQVMLPGFDAESAKKWKADDYGMRKYVMVFLKAGENRNQDAETAAKLQKGHLENIKRLADEGKLAVAGPFMDDGDARGIFIMAVETVEEARKLVETDPAVKAGRLKMEFRPWYGSAALMEVNVLHKKGQKIDF